MDEEKVEQAIAYAHDVGFDEGYECGYAEGYRDGLAEGVMQHEHTEGFGKEQ